MCGGGRLILTNQFFMSGNQAILHVGRQSHFARVRVKEPARIIWGRKCKWPVSRQQKFMASKNKTPILPRCFFLYIVLVCVVHVLRCAGFCVMLALSCAGSELCVYCALHCLALSCLALPSSLSFYCLALPCPCLVLALSSAALSYLALHCPALPYIVLPRPCLALSGTALP